MKHRITKPSKRLGQHFLKDENILKNIAETAGINKDDLVIEIGAGKGQLTKYLTDVAGLVIAVEIDKRLIKFLSSLNKENLKIYSGDILKLDIEKTIRENGKNKAIIVGNIPYYLTSPLIIKLIEKRDSISRIVLLVQKEVAERLAAQPGTKAHGSISIYTQIYTKIDIIDFVNKKKFFPVPKVDSAIIKLQIREKPLISVKNEKAFFPFIKKSFQFRRKKLAKVLAWQLGQKRENIEKIFSNLKLNPDFRAEDLSINDWTKLFDTLNALKK